MGAWIRHDPSWFIFAFLGCPDFPSGEPKNPSKQAFGDLGTENRGAPKTRKSTTTDPTPHSRPSEKMKAEIATDIAVI